MVYILHTGEGNFGWALLLALTACALLYFIFSGLKIAAKSSWALLRLRARNQTTPLLILYGSETGNTYGGTAEVSIKESAALTYNDPALTQLAVKSLEKALGKDNVQTMRAVTGAEDFSAFQEKVPGFYFFLGGLKAGNKPEEAPSHHTPEFEVDDSGLIHGVKAMVQLSLDFLQ